MGNGDVVAMAIEGDVEVVLSVVIEGFVVKDVDSSFQCKMIFSSNI